MHLTYPVRVPTVSDGEHTHPSLGIVYMCPTYKRHSFWPFHSGSLRIIGLVIYIKARIGSLKTIHHIVLFWQTSLFSVLSGWVCNTNLKLCEEKVRVRKVSRKWECSFFESLKWICWELNWPPTALKALQPLSTVWRKLQLHLVSFKLEMWNERFSHHTGTGGREGHSLILLNP